MAWSGWRGVLTAAMFMVPSAASATIVTFTDGTFNQANYSSDAFSSGGPNATIGQCASCGNPGTALLIDLSFPTGTGVFDIVFINTTFDYNPSTQGPISSISASVDKNIGDNFAGSIASNFRPAIEQDGKFYFALILGPVLTTGTGGGSTGYGTISKSGLLATDFQQFDFATGSFVAGAPNFAGDPMEFGIGSLTSISGHPADSTLFSEFDNLVLTISVPEPSTLALLASGLVFIGWRRRNRRTREIVYS